jgi:hypothetical protein
LKGVGPLPFCEGPPFAAGPRRTQGNSFR